MRKIKWIAVLVVLLIICSLVQQPVSEKNTPVEQEEVCKDKFYLEHKEECESANWVFLANKQVKRYDRPKKEKVLKKPIYQGERIRIQQIYQTTFEQWGLLFWSRDKEGNITNTTGWVKLSDLEFVYDSNAFYYDHKSEMITDKKKLCFENIRENLKHKIILWSYPCSGEMVCELNKSKYPTESQIQNGLVYQDKESRYWLLMLSCTYSTGTRWEGCSICLSDPENSNISVSKIK